MRREESDKLLKEQKEKAIEVHRSICPSKMVNGRCVNKYGIDQTCDCQCGYMSLFKKGMG